MTAKSDYLEAANLDHIFRTASLSKPASIHISLHTADPGEDGAGAEVSGGSYARVQVGPSDATWNRTNNTVSNAAQITFPTPSANWGTITHTGVWDASSGGNLLYKAALSTSKTVNNGDDAPFFAAGDLSYSED